MSVTLKGLLRQAHARRADESSLPRSASPRRRPRSLCHLCCPPSTRTQRSAKHDRVAAAGTQWRGRGKAQRFTGGGSARHRSCFRPQNMIRTFFYGSLLATLVGCGGRAEPNQGAGGASDASPSPSPDASSLANVCADGRTCTSASCPCKPTSCPDMGLVKNGGVCEASSVSTQCPSSTAAGCAHDPNPTYVPCTCRDGHWSCFTSQFDGDCCEEHGPCAASYSCAVAGAGPCGGALQLTCANGKTYERAASQPACPDGG